MSIILMLVAIAFAGIHFFNGGTFDELVPLGTMLVLFWMLDVMMHIHIIATPFLTVRKAAKEATKKT